MGNNLGLQLKELEKEESKISLELAGERKQDQYRNKPSRDQKNTKDP